MPLLFISHSSKDKAEAVQLLRWLEAQGYESMFLDSDARYGIKAGDAWEKALYREIQRSHAFIFLLSDNWIASQWCGFEFMQARALGKTIFPLRIQSGVDTQIASEIQHLDLSADREDALQRLSVQLTELTLNTRHRVAWDSARSPYPGMMSFEAADAPVFFGRDAEINRLRERLEQHRTQGSASLLVLLAASGAGKSSLLKAGLLPRLLCDRQQWLLTTALRPKANPMRQLAYALLATSDTPPDADSVETLCKGLQSDLGVEVLRGCIHSLQAEHQQWNSTLLLSIDQAEELFTTATPEQSRQFLALLAAAQAEHLHVLTLFAMRSDYLESLQSQLAQQGETALQSELFTLDPLPLERIGELIHGPAEVAALTVEDGLVTAATQDAATTDALPLLAFALRELYERFGGDGDLTLDEYRQLGSDHLSPLDNAVQSKAEQAVRPSQLNKGELKALRDAFIPRMVRVNKAGDYVRQPARWGDLPPASHPLLERLTRARLLVQQTEYMGDGHQSEKRVEVAHEALLRHWPLLNSWLREEHDYMLGKQQLEHNLREWQQVAEPEKDKALLRGLALERAREWLFAEKAGLSTDEKNYIQLSHTADENLRKRQRNLWRGFVSALMLVAGVAVWQAISATQAETKAQQQQARADTARQQAEGVINFMVFDLRDKLEPIGRLDIMRDVQERVSTYYDNSGEAKRNPRHLWQRAVNLIGRGGTLSAQGDLQGAELLYREANQFMQQRADGDPSNAGWQRDLSVSLNKVGDILKAQGKLEEAKAVFEKSMAVAEELASSDPSNAGWQTDLVVSHVKIMAIAQLLDELGSARQHGQAALAILNTLNDKGLLHGPQQQWIAIVEGMLEELN